MLYWAYESCWGEKKRLPEENRVYGKTERENDTVQAEAVGVKKEMTLAELAS